MKNWDKILDNFAHKCGDGGPDMTNPRHLALLRESLIKFGWNENATNEFIGNLRNGKEIVVEKREPGETWKTAKGWAGLKPGEDKARYGMDSEESAVAYVSGKGDDEEEPKVNFDEENELNDEKHREKVRKQYEKQREKRKKGKTREKYIKTS